MVTARYFKFWRGSVEDECFELCNVSEVKTSSSGDRLRVTMDSLYGKETIEIFFEDKFKAESFREILALNKTRTRRLARQRTRRCKHFTKSSCRCRPASVHWSSVSTSQRPR